MQARGEWGKTGAARVSGGSIHAVLMILTLTTVLLMAGGNLPPVAALSHGGGSSQGTRSPGATAGPIPHDADALASGSAGSLSPTGVPEGWVSPGPEFLPFPQSLPPTSPTGSSPAQPSNLTPSGSDGSSPGIVGGSQLAPHVMNPLGCGSICVTPEVAPWTTEDVGGGFDFWSKVSGGQSPYNYAWSGLPPGCGDSSGYDYASQFSCSPTQAGSYSVTLMVSDNYGDAGQSQVAVTVNPALTATLTASPPNVDIGQSITLNANVNGGTTPYQYNGWTDPSGSGCPSSVPANTASITCTPASFGSYSISVQISDGTGQPLLQPSVTFTVQPTLTLSLTASSTVADVGQTVTFNAHASGGNPPYSYSWSGLPPGTGCTGSSSTTSVSCSPSASGTYTVSVTVTDNGGGTATQSVQLTVYSDPTLSFSVSPGSIDYTRSATFTATVSGGDSPYTYQWSNLPPGCSGSGHSTSSLTCLPSGEGSYTVTMTITDTAGLSRTATATLNVYPNLNAIVTASPSSLDLGGTSDILAGHSGGVPGALTYAWSGLPLGPGCSATTTTTSLSCTPSSTGTWTINVVETDPTGYAASNTATLTVNPDPSVVVTSSVPSIDLGQTVTFTATPSGGSSPYSFAWSSLPPGCSSANQAALPCTPSSAGTYAGIAVTVTDSHGMQASGSLSQFIVDPTMNVLPPHLQFATQLQGPSARYGEAMTYDAADGYILLFGGTTLSSTGGTVYLGDTWTFSGGQWHALGISGPSPRTGATMAYDASDGYVILFGGGNAKGGLHDTWKFRNGQWTLLAPATSPQGRGDASMAYDAADGYVVLFGGANSSVLGDTWEYHGGNWYLVNAGGSGTPHARMLAMMSYDSSATDILLFGGDTGLANVSDTWEYKAGTWSQLHPASSPPSMLGAGMTYDPGASGTMLFGGVQIWISGFLQSRVVYLNSTWLFAGGNWAQLAVVGNQSGPLEGGAAYDSADSYVTYFGGQGGPSGYPSNETWYLPSTHSAWVDLFPSLDTGQTVTFLVTPEGGSGGYHYAWTFPTGSGCTAVDQGSIVCSFLLTGDFPISVTVTDSNGAQVTSKISFQVYSPPTNVRLSTTQSSRDVGQSFTLSASATGGTGLYAYQWIGLPAGCPAPASTQSQVTCTAAGSALGGNTIGVVVTDTNDYTPPSQPTLSETIWADPSVTSVGARWTVVDANVPDAFFGQFIGGSGGFTYTWGGLSAGCSGTNTQNPTCVFSYGTIGPLSTTFSVTDSDGLQATSSPFYFVVQSDPSPTLWVNGSTIGKTIDKNQSVRFNVSVTGGTPPYTYVYHGLPTGCSTINASFLNCTPTITGTFTVTVNVTDSGGSPSIGSQQVDVNVNPTPTITSLSANHQLETSPYWPINETYVGAYVSPLLNFTGGTPKFLGCGYFPGASFTQACNLTSLHAFSARYYYATPGTYTAKMSVLDGVDYNVSKSWNTTVFPIPQPVTLSGPAYMDTGMSATLNGSISGGSYPYSIWFNDTTSGSTICHLVVRSVGSYSTCLFAPSTAGRSTIEYTVAFALGKGQDWLGNTIPGIETYNLTVVVNPALAGFTFDAKAGNYSAAAGGSLQSEVGATVKLNGSFSGGTAPYHCAYTVNGIILQSWTTNVPPCPAASWSPAQIGSYTLNLTLTDNVSQTELGSITVNVGSGLGLGTPSILPSVPDAGVVGNLSAHLSGGLSPYTFSWNFGDGSNVTRTSQPWVFHAWQSMGLFTFSVTVSDGGGLSQTQSTQVQIKVDPDAKTLSVNDGPISSSGLVGGAVVNLPTGTSSRFNISETGGTAPFTYTWVLDGRTVGGGTTPLNWSALSLNWTSTGNYSLTAEVSDAQGMISTLSITVNVATDKILGLTLDLTPSPAYGGSICNASVTFSGGYSPYTYRWTIAINGSVRNTNTMDPRLSFVWNRLGPATVSVVVIDGFGANTTTSKDVAVIDSLNSTATLTPTRPVIDAGMWDNLSVTTVGGYGPYSYHWEIISGGITSLVNTTDPWINRTWTEVSIVTISMTMYDSFGTWASGTTVFTVDPDLQVPCAPTMSGVPMPGSSLAFGLACVEGGSPTLSFLWDLGGVSQTTSTPQVTASFSKASSYMVSVTVTDQAGVSVVSQVLTVGTIPPAITNVTAELVTSAVTGSTLHAILNTALQASDPDGQIVSYRYSTSLTNLSTMPWVNTNLHAVYLNVSKTTAMVNLYFEVEDNMGRVSSPYQLPLNTTALLPPSKSDPGNLGGTGMSTGELFLIVISVITLVMVAIVAFMSLRQRNRRSPGSEQVNTSAPPDVLTPVIAAQVKETPGQSLDLLAHTVATKTKTTMEFAKTEIAQLASTGLIEKRWEKGEEHYYPVEGSAESSEEESIRRDLETKTAVYSALEGKGWIPLEALHEATQAQTRLSRDQLAKWISDYNGEYRIEYRPAGDSLEVRLDSQAREVQSQEVMIDPAVLSAIQLDDRAVHAPEFPEPKGPAKPSRSRRLR